MENNTKPKVEKPVSVKRSLTGFTFIELMGSLVIMALILIMIGGLYASSVRNQKRASAVLSTARLGYAINGMIRRDLNSLALYPGENKIFFKIETDSDTDGRTDTLSFDATIPDTTETGVTIHRFGRITYYMDREQLTGGNLKKLYRKTVFINDEYNTEDKETEEEPEPETEDEDTKKDVGKETPVEEIDVDRDEQIFMIADNVKSFSVDVTKNASSDWEEDEVSGEVPQILKISFTLVQTTGREEETSEGDLKEQVFSSVFIPVLAQYVNNKYEEKEDDPADSSREERK